MCKYSTIEDDCHFEIIKWQACHYYVVSSKAENYLTTCPYSRYNCFSKLPFDVFIENIVSEIFEFVRRNPERTSYRAFPSGRAVGGHVSNTFASPFQTNYKPVTDSTNLEWEFQSGTGNIDAGYIVHA